MEKGKQIERPGRHEKGEYRSPTLERYGDMAEITRMLVQGPIDAFFVGQDPPPSGT